MYDIVLTDGKIVTIHADEVEWCERSRMIKFIYEKRVVARINMDNVVGWIYANYKVANEDTEHH